MSLTLQTTLKPQARRAALRLRRLMRCFLGPLGKLEMEKMPLQAIHTATELRGILQKIPI